MQLVTPLKSALPQRSAALRSAPMLAALACLLSLSLHPAAQAQGKQPDIMLAQAFDTAQQDYERCHWRLAFEQLGQLADSGHAPAARMVMQMARFGPRLYGQTFTLSPAQVERYIQLQWQVQVAGTTGAR